MVFDTSYYKLYVLPTLTVEVGVAQKKQKQKPKEMSGPGICPFCQEIMPNGGCSHLGLARQCHEFGVANDESAPGKWPG